jgi:hypothetical protein
MGHSQVVPTGHAFPWAGSSKLRTAPAGQTGDESDNKENAHTNERSNQNLLSRTHQFDGLALSNAKVVR